MTVVAFPAIGAERTGTAPPARWGTWGGVNGVGKRLFDLLVGSALFVVSFPLLVTLAVAVAVSLRTWRPIFLQQRVGRGGRRFTLPKLRTLPTSAPRYADKYAIADIPLTRVGRFLRATHLDELPQLALVAIGQMSLVGPRPEMAQLLSEAAPEFVAARLAVRPGCTGLWQVSADACKLIGEVPHYDVCYVRHATARLDLWILWHTLGALTSNRSGSSMPAWVWEAGEPRPAVRDLAVCGPGGVKRSCRIGAARPHHRVDRYDELDWYYRSLASAGRRPS